jgi:quercetin dioxygenase-like cupin family protein
MGINTTLASDGRLSADPPRPAVVPRSGVEDDSGTRRAGRAAEQRRSPVGLGGLVDIVTGLARVGGLWRVSDPAPGTAREGRRLIATEAYEVWLLAWPPGSSVEPHDHGDADGAFVVCSGELAEVRWDGSQRSTRRLTVGDVATVPAGVVHDVVAAGSSAAVSIHAYSPSLREMRFYDGQAARVIAVEAVVEEPTLFDARSVAAVLHPATRG